MRLYEKTASELSEMLKNKECSAVELCNDVLARINETENSNKDMFGIDRLKEVVYQNKDREPEEIKESILKAITDFRGDYEQVDDLTFVILKK